MVDTFWRLPGTETLVVDGLDVGDGNPIRHDECPCGCPTKCTEACKWIQFSIKSAETEPVNNSPEPDDCCADPPSGYDSEWDIYFQAVLAGCLPRDLNVGCQWHYDAVSTPSCDAEDPGADGCDACPKQGDGDGSAGDPSIEDNGDGEWVLHCEGDMWILENVNGTCGASEGANRNVFPAFGAPIDRTCPREPPMDPNEWSLINAAETCWPDAYISCLSCICPGDPA